jgi:hypothetical protein
MELSSQGKAGTMMSTERQSTSSAAAATTTNDERRTTAGGLRGVDEWSDKERWTTTHTRMGGCPLFLLYEFFVVE